MSHERINNQQHQLPIEAIFGSITSPSDELDRVLAEIGVEADIREAIFADIDRKLKGMRHSCSSADEYAEKFIAAHNQGEQWRVNRERLGLRIDEVAHHVGLDIYEMMLLESGLPSYDGQIEELSEKLSIILQQDNR